MGRFWRQTVLRLRMGVGRGEGEGAGSVFGGSELADRWSLDEEDDEGGVDLESR